MTQGSVQRIPYSKVDSNLKEIVLEGDEPDITTLVKLVQSD